MANAFQPLPQSLQGLNQMYVLIYYIYIYQDELETAVSGSSTDEFLFRTYVL